MSAFDLAVSFLICLIGLSVYMTCSFSMQRKVLLLKKPQNRKALIAEASLKTGRYQWPEYRGGW
jgi:hypothetical protein